MATYTDIDFNFTRNSFTNDLNLVQDLTAVRQSIKNIVLTMRGEKSFNFLFGGSAQRLIFESTGNISVDDLSRINLAIRTEEPRVTLKEITYSFEDELTLVLNINFEYNASGLSENLSDSVSLTITGDSTSSTSGVSNIIVPTTTSRSTASPTISSYSY